MRAERRRFDAWIWTAVLAWGCVAAASWEAARRAMAQDAPEQQREKTRDQPEAGARPSVGALPEAGARRSVGALSPAERREKIRSMSPAEKEDLLDRQKHFLKLDPAKQERLRELCNKVEADPDADALLQVMHRYYDWLRTTHSDAQLVLAGLSPEKRVAKIKELLKAEEESARKEGIGPGFPPFPWSGRDPRMLKLYSNRGRPPRPSDMADREGVLKWQEKYVNQHSSELLAKISSPNRKELKEQLEQAKATDYLHRYGVAAMVLLRWQLEMADRNAMPPGLTSAELEELRSGLSEPTRTRLENRDPAAQWRFASGLIREFVLRQSAARKATPAWSLVSDEELAEFFDKLSPRQRADLTKLSGDRMAQALLEMYIGSVLGPGPGLPPGFGPGGKGGGPPGARRGPGFGPFDLSPPGKREKGKEGEGVTR